MVSACSSGGEAVIENILSPVSPSIGGERMRAAVLQKVGGPEVLHVEEVQDLAPGLHQVRVRVVATALNRADIMQREGCYPGWTPQPGAILGLEFAGTIDALGPDVTHWQIGDRVFGLIADGGYAEQVVTHQRMLMSLPTGVSYEEAAAIPEVFFTVYDALVDRASLRLGDVVLVHAGASGVGTAAIQLAKAMGTRVFVTVGTEEKARKARELGADKAILYREERFEEVVLVETGGRGADVILDSIGGPYLERNIKAAATMGRIVLVGNLGGGHAEIDITPFFRKRLTVVGTTLRARPIEQKIGLTQRFAAQVLPLFAIGQLRSVVDRIFTLEYIGDAHRYMEENRNFGKIVVRTT